MPRYTTDEQRRLAFRDWLRGELRRLDFYQRRGDRYLVSVFARYAASRGAYIDEVSLARYLRDRNPVLPTPERCRDLARALGIPPIVALLKAAYVTGEDFVTAPALAPAAPVETHTGAQVARELDRIEREMAGYGLLPEPIREDITAALRRRATGGDV